MYRFLAPLWGSVIRRHFAFRIRGRSQEPSYHNERAGTYFTGRRGRTDGEYRSKAGRANRKNLPGSPLKKSEAKVQVRVKVLADGIMAPQQRDLLENIQMDENWFYCEKDGYFYCAEKLCEGKKVHFQAKITVPPKWKEWTEDLQFRLELAADGV